MGDIIVRVKMAPEDKESMHSSRPIHSNNKRLRSGLNQSTTGARQSITHMVAMLGVLI